MNLKKIRISVGAIAGLVAAALSLIWLLFIDIKLKANATWLIAALGLGLIPGICLTMGSYFANEDEQIKSVFFLFISFVLFIFFLVVLGNMANNATIIASAKKVPAFSTLRVLIFVCFTIISVISLAASIFDLIAKINAKKEKI